MDTRQLAAFVLVAELGSFTGAASELGCSQPTVTARIKALEEELGVRLFQRLPRGVRTTHAGDVLRGYAHRIILLNDGRPWPSVLPIPCTWPIVVSVPFHRTDAYSPEYDPTFAKAQRCLLYPSAVCGLPGPIRYALMG